MAFSASAEASGIALAKPDLPVEEEEQEEEEEEEGVTPTQSKTGSWSHSSNLVEPMSMENGKDKGVRVLGDETGEEAEEGEAEGERAGSYIEVEPDSLRRRRSNADVGEGERTPLLLPKQSAGYSNNGNGQYWSVESTYERAELAWDKTKRGASRIQTKQLALEALAAGPAVILG